MIDAATDGADGLDGVSRQLGRAPRDHAAETDEDRRGIQTEERVDARLELGRLFQDPRIRRHGERRPIVAERREIAVGRDDHAAAEEMPERAVDRIQADRRAAAVDRAA